MSKQITSGVVGSQRELRGLRSQQRSDDVSTDRAPLDPEQTETIRGFADQIVRQLCERHRQPQDQSDQNSGFFGLGE